MIYLIIWYLIGVLSLFWVAYIVDGHVNVLSLVLALTLGGLFGVFTFAFGVYAFIDKNKDTPRWENFWERKMF